MNKQLSVLPARVILVDLSSATPGDTYQHLCETLEHLFVLVCNLGGPCRVPYFGLFAVNNNENKLLFPIQHVRGKLSTIQRALQDLQLLQADQGVDVVMETEAARGLGLMEALKKMVEMFTAIQTSWCWLQLEITMVTCQGAEEVTKQLASASRDEGLKAIKKLHVVGLRETFVTIEDELLCSQETDSSEASSGEDGFPIEISTIDNEEMSLQQFFMSWLHDSNTDQEQLHVLLPSFTGEADDESIVIKCDLQERMLNPQLLPHSQQFDLQQEGSGTQKTVSTAAPYNKGTSQVIHRLKVIQRVPAEAVCESILFGHPLIVRPTCCWKLDWDELSTNSANFLALGHKMQQQDFCLLAMSDPATAPLQRGRPCTPLPQGHFLLMPSHSGALLLKAVAPSELLLPCDFQSQEKVAEDALEIVGASLDQLELVSSLNPLKLKSGILECLVWTSRPPGPPGAPTAYHQRQETSTRGRKPMSAQPLFAEPPSANKKPKICIGGGDLYRREPEPFPQML